MLDFSPYVPHWVQEDRAQSLKQGCARRWLLQSGYVGGGGGGGGADPPYSRRIPLVEVQSFYGVLSAFVPLRIPRVSNTPELRTIPEAIYRGPSYILRNIP